MHITDTTPSTSTSTGALIVDGGVGIGGNINIGGAANIAGPLTCQSINTGVGVTDVYSMDQDVTTGDDVEFASVTTDFADITTAIALTTVGSQTAPTLYFTGDTNTGIYRVAADNLGITAGGSLRASFSSAGVKADALTSDTNLIITGGTASGTDLTLRSTSDATKGNVLIDETTESSSKTSGALVVSGGVGISKLLHSGNHIITGSTTNKLTINDATNRVTGTSSAGYINYMDSISFIGDAQNRYTSSGGVPQTLVSIISQYATPKGDPDWTTPPFFDSDQGAGELAIHTRDSSSSPASTTMTEVAWFNSQNTSIHVPTIITDTTASTSSTTGALSVAGGLGVAGSIFGNALIITGGTTASNDLILRSTSNATKGRVLVDEDENATSTTTGSLVVVGGFGLGQDFHIGGNILGHGFTTMTGGDGAGEDLTLRSTTNATKGYVYLDESTPTTSTTTGALRINGGIGLGGGIYAGGEILYSNVIISDTSNTSGAFVASVTVKYFRIGNSVTLEIPDILVAATSASILTLGLTFPVGYRPSSPNNSNHVVRVRDNTVNQFGLLQVTTGGAINIYADATASTFAGTGSTGIFATSVTFTI